MKTLGQLGIILGLAYCGHLIAVGLSVPLPASVIGMVLLLAGLRLRWIPEKWVDHAAYFLSANMAFFFLPSAVEIIENIDHVRADLIKLIVVCIISTVITFFISYVSVCALQKLTSKKDIR